MGQGSVSSAVRALQTTLSFCYGKNIAVDGDFGPATRQALIEVQRSSRIAADGVYGPQTRDALGHRMTGPGCGIIAQPPRLA
ncbi:peptidoglycan-binding domain-containing protein [Micromonospora sp. WMMD1082]|uniref:peptidoglycan-binding domain-containing protein n=1 Tax=Micromonospora sp. WMMD1082 TaxID=3016104 RepID=UPI002416EE47|nr:peptidoglycan-binding domain-containing protein [Micromonospora sp. WMMD1082]MDG4797650.1 peptidoglycan-binding domain-containing protein [Micromonospora sp. WMMD1082]